MIASQVHIRMIVMRYAHRLALMSDSISHLDIPNISTPAELYYLQLRNTTSCNTKLQVIHTVCMFKHVSKPRFRDINEKSLQFGRLKVPDFTVACFRLQLPPHLLVIIQVGNYMCPCFVEHFLTMMLTLLTRITYYTKTSTQVYICSLNSTEISTSGDSVNLCPHLQFGSIQIAAVPAGRFSFVSAQF